MPFLDELFRTPGRTPTLYDRPAFWRRHFWPPSAFGAAVYVVVISVVVAFIGTYIYAKIDAGRTRPIEPGSRPATAGGALADDTPVPDVTATTMSPVLSPEDLATKVSASVWSVRTLDETGRPVVGSAFVAGSFGGQTLLLTSLAVVRASTAVPSPPIQLQQGGRTITATLWTWQEERDLALIVIGGGSPQLTWAGEPDTKEGDKVYVVPGPASSRRPAQGNVISISPTSIQHNAVVEEDLQGGPLVNDRGELLGMASAAYDEGGRGTDKLFFAVPIRAACDRVLQCGAGNVAAEAGDQPTNDPGAPPTTRPPAGATTRPPAGTTTRAPATTTTTP